LVRRKELLEPDSSSVLLKILIRIRQQNIHFKMWSYREISVFFLFVFFSNLAPKFIWNIFQKWIEKVIQNFVIFRKKKKSRKGNREKGPKGNLPEIRVCILS
jgi:hypothetical protein